MAGKVLKMNNMRKINNSAIMNKSAENPATTNTYNRCLKAVKKFHIPPPHLPHLPHLFIMPRPLFFQWCIENEFSYK